MFPISQHFHYGTLLPMSFFHWHYIFHAIYYVKYLSLQASRENKIVQKLRLQKHKKY